MMITEVTNDQTAKYLIKKIQRRLNKSI